jgi:hypothetical protein
VRIKERIGADLCWANPIIRATIMLLGNGASVEVALSECVRALGRSNEVLAKIAADAAVRSAGSVFVERTRESAGG